MSNAVEQQPKRSFRRRWRRKAINGVIKSYARLGEYFAEMRAARAHVEVVTDVAYGPHPYNKLDIFRPIFAPRPLKVLLYIHGGAFMLCSKETHRGIAMSSAMRSDYLVFNIDYRLAPRFQFPGAHEDACRAYAWVAQHCAEYGGDPNHIVVAGESAGGNLALSVAVASSYRRPEPWAQAVYDAPVRPLAVQPIMPYLQISSPGRRSLSTASSYMALDVAHDIASAYLGRANTQASVQTLMADPIRVLEECGVPDRPFPQVWSGVGTADLCCDDVQRLEQACKKHSIPAQIDYYENEAHAFHAFRWRPAAQRFWRQNFDFLRLVAALPAAAVSPSL